MPCSPRHKTTSVNIVIYPRLRLERSTPLESRKSYSSATLSCRGLFTAETMMCLTDTMRLPRLTPSLTSLDTLEMRIKIYCQFKQSTYRTCLPGKHPNGSRSSDWWLCHRALTTQFKLPQKIKYLFSPN